eukprot:6878214-Alexandrium_andersonii.AAC.1
MSASLVGSEMCIRDRCSCPPPSLPSRTAASWPPARKRKRACRVLGGCTTCLLYTSDAADDM